MEPKNNQTSQQKTTKPRPNQPQVHPKPNKTSPGPSSLLTKIIKTLNQKFENSTGTENAFYSPMSIALALAMVYEGTEKNLRSDFEQILGFSPDRSAKQDSMEFVDGLLSSGKKGGFQLTVANSLWNTELCSLQPAFVGCLQTMFKAHCEKLDLHDPEGSCDKVNGWIAAKTAGMITDMLTPTSFTPGLLLILVNAIYFKAHWQKTFKKSATTLDTWNFRTPDTPKLSKKTKFMHMTDKFLYTDYPNCQMIALPYLVTRTPLSSPKNISMVILKPKPGFPLSQL
jgi:serine protease inhibitor